ncbi:hypothetical protein QTO34_015874 [Cnephaeus nilssonii]|uniref:Core shell protein Gag P30 domain-containing protein n=1 Tax=Cnephaeus nilssonii TaxID=3371016 RepID=A0AA40I5N9_CNENI|nr:hypothetical protein QTO34_015874 [Eptesicus nilssonii]
MGSGQGKLTVLNRMLKNFKKGFDGDYGIKMNSETLRKFCEVEWPAFWVGWPSEGSLDEGLVRAVWNVVTGDPGHPDQFPYIDSWLEIAQTLPPWVRFCMCKKRQSKVLVAGVERQAGQEQAKERQAGQEQAKERQAGQEQAKERQAGQEQAKERQAGQEQAKEKQAGEEKQVPQKEVQPPILQDTPPPPEEVPPVLLPPYEPQAAPSAPFSPPPPRTRLVWKVLKVWKHHPPSVSPQPGSPEPVGWCLRSADQGPKQQLVRQMPLREFRGDLKVLGEDGTLQEERLVYYYQPFTTSDILNWKQHTPAYSEKPQAMVDLLEKIFQTQKPTWVDRKQLLFAFFNTEEHMRVMTEAQKWLQTQAPRGTLDTDRWAREALPDEEPNWYPN